VRFIRVLLSLYSIQLIIISALLITYLTVTAGNRTEAQRGNTLVTVREGLYSIVTGLEARGGDGGIRTATSPLFTIKGELEALRSIKSMILLAETDKSASGEISGDAENKILMKAAKQRKESADIFQQQNRQDLAEKELFQLEVISRYLPKQLSEAEVRAHIDAIVKATGATGIKDMGKVMAEMKAKYAGQLDFSKASALVKEKLTG